MTRFKLFNLIAWLVVFLLSLVGLALGPNRTAAAPAAPAEIFLDLVLVRHDFSYDAYVVTPTGERLSLAAFETRGYELVGEMSQDGRAIGVFRPPAGKATGP